MNKKLLLAYTLTIATSLNAYAGNSLLEPKTRINEGIAITIDMCSGNTDKRIIDLLIQKQIKATFFVTNKWIDRNIEVVNLIDSHPELFKVENHGKSHLAAITDSNSPYRLKTVGDIQNLKEEVKGGDSAITQNFKEIKPTNYYRTAGAQYSKECYNWLIENDYKIGGYTIAADGGAKYPWKITLQNLNKAKPGDVILIHGNHPESGNFQALKYYLNSNKNNIFTWLS